MSEKVRHIMKRKARLCGSQGNYEPVGTDTKLPICNDCRVIHYSQTGEWLYADSETPEKEVLE